ICDTMSILSLQLGMSLDYTSAGGVYINASKNAALSCTFFFSACHPLHAGPFRVAFRSILTSRPMGEIALCKLTEFLQEKGKNMKTVKTLSETHAKQHKIPRVNFEIISDVIVKVVAEKIEGFGTDAQTALKNVLKTFQTNMGACCDEPGFDK
uniref:Myoglobin n=1 Tax=Erpetoichthys calabaricus TaxID=27687 RepID=A0A8C4RVZ4_ERPCA